MVTQDEQIRGHFATRLKLYREQAELTQKDLSSVSLVPPAVISHYESGHRSPNIGALVRLALALDISVDCLLGLDD